MSETFTDPRLATLDGFRVEVDAARERADVILDRPPLNVVSMPQRDQLRLVFEALDLDDRVRVIVLRAIGENFSSGGNIKGFMEATPETVSKLAWNIAAPARCSKPVIVANRGFCFGVGFELSLACDFRHGIRDHALRPARAAARADPRLRRLGATAEDRRHHPHQGHRDALAAHSGASKPTIGASPPNACRTASSKRQPMRWLTSCVPFRRSRSAQQRSSSTIPRMLC